MCLARGSTPAPSGSHEAETSSRHVNFPNDVQQLDWCSSTLTNLPSVSREVQTRLENTKSRLTWAPLSPENRASEALLSIVNYPP